MSALDDSAVVRWYETASPVFAAIRHANEEVVGAVAATFEIAELNDEGRARIRVAGESLRVAAQGLLNLSPVPHPELAAAYRRVGHHYIQAAEAIADPTFAANENARAAVKASLAHLNAAAEETNQASAILNR